MRSLLTVAAVLTLAIPGAPAHAAAPAQYKVPAATSATTSTCNIAIPMSDGVRLFADLVAPDRPARRPTIVTVTGYNKGAGQYGACNASDALFATHGYNRLTVDDRGTGNSEGSWDSWGPRMQQDYKELLDWLVKQPWSDGTVGMTGGSYMGITSFLVAETMHPAVKTIWADVPMADAYRDVTLHGGSINAAFIPLWLGLVAGLGALPPSWTFDDPGAGLVTEATHLASVAGFQGNTILNYSTDGDLAYDGAFYQVRSPETKAAALDIPIAWTGGWFDLFQRGEARLYNDLKRLGPDRKKWFMSPTYHAAGNSHWDEMGLGSKDAVVLAWFDHWMKKAPNGIEAIPSINHWKMGAEAWAHPAAWPVPTAAWTRYLLGEGSLATTAGPPGADALPVIPLVGFCSRSITQWSAGLVLAGSNCETDNRLAEATALTYTTSDLKSDVEITGPITATIWGTLNRPEADLVAILTDVDASGKSTQVTGGWLNASQRALDPARSIRIGTETIVPFHPFTKAAQKAVPSGEAQRYDIEIFPTSQVFKAGHRIRLTIGTSDAHTLPTTIAAVNSLGGVFTLLRDAGHPSSVLLPIVPASAGATAVKATSDVRTGPQHVLPVTGRGTPLLPAALVALLALVLGGSTRARGARIRPERRR
ncbi:MAG TPA: CocE/NonD family hydrolase [Acidimicrobiales bacterium]|nr:CocE/NonD family hydrolase [Acidimicrobiales bacterium]